MRRGNYGYDAPYALIGFAAFTLFLAVDSASAWLSPNPNPGVSISISLLFLWFLFNTACYYHTTRRGKFAEWERILDRIDLRGGENVLDMGCGRGAVLTAVARRLTTGRVTGIDIWSRTDQSGNGAEVTQRNASLEGVAFRVRIETADMRALPFRDASFDLVVSSLAIHNISSNDDRRKAISEAFRVLKPGGRLAIADIRATRIYSDTLLGLGASAVERRPLGWRFWWGNPIARTTLLTASKPEQT